MNTSKVTYRNLDFQFSDSDIVNPDDFIAQGEYNPHNVHPFLLHDSGFPVAVVFADCLQDALDIACDENKLDRYLIPEPSNTPGSNENSPLCADDYPTLGTQNEEGITRLGNASEPFDIDTLGVVELRNPPFSFCALFNAATDETRQAVSGFPY